VPLRLAVALACLTFAVASPAPAGAVVGGDEADAGEWPWQVSLQVDGEHLCGGTLVALDRVLTAAHCTDGLGASDMTVVAGTVDLGDDDDRRDVVVLEQHEDYDPDHTSNDLSLLTLDAPFTEGAGIEPAAIPDPATARALVASGDDVVVTGFGATSEDGDISQRLLEAEITVIGDDECTDRYAEDGDVVFGETQVCAGRDRGHVDACYGDSGGPLVAPADDERASWFLVGVVSWGAGCGRPLRPTVYTEVAAFVDWLAAHGGVGDTGGARFTSDTRMRLPAPGATRGKASTYPSTVVVDGVDAPVASVTVGLHGLSHDAPADLDIWLVAPDGTAVTVLSDIAGDRAVEGVDVLVEADGPSAPPSGGFALRMAPTDLEPGERRKGARPPASFDSLVGIDPNGQWRLYVGDDERRGTGTLEGWSLVIR
jgi:secreted trypsin-like serine protease